MHCREDRLATWESLGQQPAAHSLEESNPNAPGAWKPTDPLLSSRQPALEVSMARPCPLPSYGLEELEPLVAPLDAAAPIKLRPSPRPSQLDALFGQATVEHNVQELSADLGQRKRIIICT